MISTRAALCSRDTSAMVLGGRATAELAAIARGELVVVGAPSDARLPRSVAGHVAKTKTAKKVAKPAPPPPAEDDDEDDEDDLDDEEEQPRAKPKPSSAQPSSYRRLVARLAALPDF
jgi:hypothetical protein